MLISLGSLFTELNMSIFKSLNNFDDSRDLRRTCRQFSLLYTGNKEAIERSIIVSSNRKIKRLYYNQRKFLDINKVLREYYGN